jgi:hypothetical protein
MVNPNPVPSNFLLYPSLTCLKGLKMISSLSSGIPIPVSSTSIFTFPLLYVVDIVTEPCSVYLMALLKDY